MSTFVQGLILAERFYHEAVRPLLDANFPSLPHGAGLIGTGSEVLGFDSSVSSDHHWGPRAQLFLSDDTYEYAEPIREMLRRNLPHTFLGWPTNFTDANPEDHGAQMLRATSGGPVNHRVHVGTLRDFFLAYLGCDLREPLHPIDWLTFPSQKLRSIVAGAVFRDDVGLQDVRDRFAWYPHDVWLYLLAAGWQRIGQEEHLMGRAGEVGDEIGSSLIAGRLVRDLMRLCFLMEHEYAPYAKWYGTAFARLRAAHSLSPLLWQALRAEVWPERDRVLGEAYSAVARMHNALGVHRSPTHHDRAILRATVLRDLCGTLGQGDRRADRGSPRPANPSADRRRRSVVRLHGPPRGGLVATPFEGPVSLV